MTIPPSSGGWGEVSLSKIVATVGTATTASTTAGASVHAISSGVFPWVCLGSGSPGFRRYRITAYSSIPSTTTKTKTAAQNIQ